jgi:hypothetical protein
MVSGLYYTEGWQSNGYKKKEALSDQDLLKDRI